MTLTELLTSAVVAALVSALVSLRNSERRIQIENITQERAKWRDKIRKSALLVHRAAVSNDKTKLKELHLVLRTNLNPFDDEDKLILRCIEDLAIAEEVEHRLAEFSGRVSHLLKHDWERAKFEAKPWFSRRRAPTRVPYS